MNIQEKPDFDCLDPIKTTFQYCPRCGSHGFKPDSEKSFRCKPCGFQYYFNPGGAVAGILLHPDGRILMTRRAHEPGKGTLDLPGGFIDLLETAEDALTREVKEELGVGISQLEFLCTRPNRYDYGGMTYYTVDLAFIAMIPDPGKVQLSDEVLAVEWIPPLHIRWEEIGFSSIREILHEFIRRKVQK